MMNRYFGSSERSVERNSLRKAVSIRSGTMIEPPRERITSFRLAIRAPHPDKGHPDDDSEHSHDLPQVHPFLQEQERQDARPDVHRGDKGIEHRKLSRAQRRDEQKGADPIER